MNERELIDRYNEAWNPGVTDIGQTDATMIASASNHQPARAWPSTWPVLPRSIFQRM